KRVGEKSYADFVALAQYLPGQASSQVGFGIGGMCAGVLGGDVSFMWFSLSCVIALILYDLLLTGCDISYDGCFRGLKIAAVEVFSQAIIGMAKKLTPDLKRKTIALFALVGTLIWQTAFTQVGVILIAALFGFLLYKQHQENEEVSSPFPIAKRIS